MISRLQKLRQAIDSLKKSGIETPETDAALLMAFTEKTTVDDIRLRPEKQMTAPDAFDACLKRRLAFEPVSKIVGEKGFWKHDFYVSADVLDPRPDSETLLDAVERAFPDFKAPLRVLDLGTGSGCLILSVLADYPAARGAGVDISGKALDVAVKNARRLGVADRFSPVNADWSDASFAALFHEPFDVVLCNPPYIGKDEKLSKETLFDPKRALFADENGLADYRVLAEKLEFLLAENGTAFFELGAGQAAAVKAFFEKNGFKSLSLTKDFGGIERCLTVKR